MSWGWGNRSVVWHRWWRVREEPSPPSPVGARPQLHHHAQPAMEEQEEEGMGDVVEEPPHPEQVSMGGYTMGPQGSICGPDAACPGALPIHGASAHMWMCTVIQRTNQPLEVAN